MEHTENENKAAGAPSALNVELASGNAEEQYWIKLDSHGCDLRILHSGAVYLEMSGHVIVTTPTAIFEALKAANDKA